MITALLARYGLLAILLGAGLEGEAVVVAGGIAARGGAFPLAAAMAAATIGSTIVDQLWFAVARRYASHRRVVRVTRNPRFARVRTTIDRYPVAVILGFRFVYGMRTITPVALGLSDVRHRLFAGLNIVAAAIWAPLFTWIGWRLGPLAWPLLHRVAGFGLKGVAAGGVLAGVALVVLWRRRRR